MTFKEATERKVRKIRKATWADPKSHVEMPEQFPDGTHSPWCLLRDMGTVTALLWYELEGDDDWEELKEEV